MHPTYNWKTSVYAAEIIGHNVLEQQAHLRAPDLAPSYNSKWLTSLPDMTSCQDFAYMRLKIVLFVPQSDNLPAKAVCQAACERHATLPDGVNTLAPRLSSQ